MQLEPRTEPLQESSLLFKTLLKAVLSSLRSAVEVQDSAADFSPHFFKVTLCTQKPIVVIQDQRVQASKPDKS